VIDRDEWEGIAVEQRRSFASRSPTSYTSGAAVANAFYRSSLSDLRHLDVEVEEVRLATSRCNCCRGYRTVNNPNLTL